MPMCFQKSASSTATIALRSTGGMSRNETTTRFSIANSPITLPSFANTCVMMFGWNSSSEVTWGRSLSNARNTPRGAPPQMAAAKSAVTTTRRSVRTRGGAAGANISGDYDAAASVGHLDHRELGRAQEAQLRRGPALHADAGRDVERHALVVVQAGGVEPGQARLRVGRAQPGQHHLPTVRVPGEREVDALAREVADEVRAVADRDPKVVGGGAAH